MALRVVLTVIFPLTLLAAPLAAAQPAGKVYRIGYIGTVPPPAYMWDSLLAGLRERGWVEGQNIVFERRFSEGRAERFTAFAAELVQLKVDILLTAGGGAPARAAMAATSTVPIVMVTVGDPLGQKLVPNLARPGGNVTGLSLVVDWAIDSKRLELLKEGAPRISRVAVLHSRILPEATFLPWYKELEATAAALRVTLVPARADNPDQFAEAFTAITQERADAIFATETGPNFRHRQLIADFASSRRLPAINAYREAVEAGGLMSYGVSLADIYRRAAGYVDKIFKGARPGDLPIELPTKFELIINLKAAKTLGLTIPQPVLVRADMIIQ